MKLVATSIFTLAAAVAAVAIVLVINHHHGSTHSGTCTKASVYACP